MTVAKRDRWHQLTCGFRRTEKDPECQQRPIWRLTSPLRRDWDPGLSPFRQQYTCDGHLEEAVERYGTQDHPVVYEPLDDCTITGAPLVESRDQDQRWSSREYWIRFVRGDKLVEQGLSRRSAYVQTALEWFADHPDDQP